MESLGAERGLQQTAYQIIVSDEKETLCGIVEKHKMDSL